MNSGRLAPAPIAAGVLCSAALCGVSFAADPPQPTILDRLSQLAQSARPSPDDQYAPGPDSLPQAGVPQGKLFEFSFDHSRIFPGTTRKISVYVPAEYTADKPACVYIGLDGLVFAAPTVFDNLIYKHEMPITIAVGIGAGTVPAAEPGHDARYNRSFEFDSLNDSLARLVLEEILPEVERHMTPGGLPIRLSANPNDRAAAGGSTGGVGAFTLAWQRPDAFRRVFTAIGTFVGMRGADRYAVLVRKTEPKPIRFFMQDGSNDELTPFLGDMGSWWMSNQGMERALEFAGYAIEHVWGEGTHSGKQPTAVFPDAMRFLWKDWPEPVVARASKNVFLTAVLQAAEDWQSVAGDYQADGFIAADTQGSLVFRDSQHAQTWTIDAAGRLSEQPWLRGNLSGLAFGADGRSYAADADRGRVLVYGSNAKPMILVSGVRSRYLLISHSGNLYATEAQDGRPNSGKLWLVRPDGKKLQLDAGLDHPAGIALSPDGLWLAVAESHAHWGYSYQLKSDGTVQYRQRYYWFYVPDEADDSGAAALAMDRQGRLFAATRLGVQILDHNGRSRAIVPVPGGEAVGLAFGGSDFDILYVSCSDHKIYRRKLKVQGAQSWAAPLEIPDWGPG